MAKEPADVVNIARELGKLQPFELYRVFSLLSGKLYEQEDDAKELETLDDNLISRLYNRIAYHTGHAAEEALCLSSAIAKEKAKYDE